MSPNSHSRVAPERSPAAPALFMSRWPWRPDILSATSLSSALPSWRIALGLSLSWPSVPRLRVPPSRSAFSSCCSVLASTAAWSPELAGERVEVEVVHAGAAVGLRELLGELVEVGEVLEDAGAVAEPESLALSLALAVTELLGAAPVLPGAQPLEVGVEAGQRLHQLR